MLITSALPIGLYARVFTNRQAEAQTVDSQVAALRERISHDAPRTPRVLEFVDEGYSGTTLVRPALERMRDLAAAGRIKLLYVQSPDRLARKYAHQALVLDEFSRVGVRVVFLNRASQQTSEDELLVQVQGVIAEYERAKIIERTRRGRRHAAQHGSVSALVHAPYGYGYRYVGKAQGADLPHYEVVLDEARVVRQIFDWVGRERLSIGAAVRRLEAQGIPTRTGKRRWNRGTVRQILQNPTYKGAAAYGRTQSVPWRRLAVRAAKHHLKHHPEHPRRSSSVEPALLRSGSPFPPRVARAGPVHRRASRGAHQRQLDLKYGQTVGALRNAVVVSLRAGSRSRCAHVRPPSTLPSEYSTASLLHRLL